MNTNEKALAALKEQGYLRHKPWCDKSQAAHLGIKVDIPCTCGMDKFIAALESQPIPTVPTCINCGRTRSEHSELMYCKASNGGTAIWATTQYQESVESQSGAVPVIQALDEAIALISTTTILIGEADRQDNWRLVASIQKDQFSKVLGLLSGLRANLTVLESQPVAGQVGEAYDGSTGHDSWCRSIPQVIRGIVQTGPCNCSLRTAQQPQPPTVGVTKEEIALVVEQAAKTYYSTQTVTLNGVYRFVGQKIKAFLISRQEGR